MKTGVSTASLFLRKYNEEALPLLSELGVKTAEVFLTTFSEYAAEFAKTVAENKGDISVNSAAALSSCSSLPSASIKRVCLSNALL